MLEMYLYILFYIPIYMEEYKNVLIGTNAFSSNWQIY
jgi:hypothetical protein